MSFSSFFSSLFKTKHKQKLQLPESLLVKKLKQLTKENENLHIFENITIYHHSKSFFISLIIVDTTRGIFLFEHKDWSYNDLKNAKVSKATNLDSSQKTLAFDKAHNSIDLKFKELTHTNNVPIYNYLLMENINKDQYLHLNNTFKELLPEEKIMFNDISQELMLEKIKKVDIPSHKLPALDAIMTTILVQYAVVQNEYVSFATQEQIKFLESPLTPFTTVKGVSGSGKTSAILLKAMLEKLKNPNLDVIIVKPTNLACEILKKKLIDTAEHGIVEIDLTSIIITTPSTLKTNYAKFSGLILCDDSFAYEKEFISHLNTLRRKNKIIIFENIITTDATTTFTTAIKCTNKKLAFHMTNPHAKALQLISTLLTSNAPKEILLLANNSSKIKLKDDLADFIQEDVTLVDSTQTLLQQNLESIRLSSYEDMYALEAKHIILMDIDYLSKDHLYYAYNLSQESVSILYEDASDNIDLIRKNFEDTKDG